MNLSKSLWSLYNAAFGVVAAGERTEHLRRLIQFDDDEASKARTMETIAGYDADAVACRRQVNEALAEVRSFKSRSLPDFIKRVDEQSEPWLSWIQRVRDVCAKIQAELGDASAVRALLPALRNFAIEAEQLDTQRGRKTIEGAAAAHVATHGTSEDREAKYRAWQADVDRQIKDGLTITSARRNTAERFGVDPKTVERHTKNV
jgi:hypothetical protein